MNFANHAKLLARPWGQLGGEGSLNSLEIPGKRNDEKSKKFSKEKGQAECFQIETSHSVSVTRAICSALETEWGT